MRSILHPMSLLPAPFRVLLILLAAVAAPGLAGAAEPVPIAAFFDHPAVGGAKLSPDGRHLAMRVGGADGRDRLGVLKLADMSVKVVAAFPDADVGNFEWVNNARLLYDSREKDTAPGDQAYAPGLFAVNLDGSARRQLVEVTGRDAITGPALGRAMLPWNTFMLHQAGAQDSDWVYVETRHYARDYSLALSELVRLNTVSGKSETVEAPGTTRSWWLDAHGNPALATTAEEGGMQAIHYLDPKDKRWRKLASGSAYLGGPFSPLGFTPDGALYVTSRDQDDKSALFQYDLAAGKLSGKPIVNLEEFDFDGELVTDATGLLGVRYTADAVGTAWFDAAMKQVQKSVDSLLPNRINVLSVARRAQTPYVLVDSWSDRQPHVYWLYNRETKALRKIGATLAGIDPARMAAMDLVQVKARDGLKIPVWVTAPDGAKGKKLPMVVLVHGGPFVRGHQWAFDADGQFLASRGYVVLQPEFRGSTGYGARHFRAGWKQWGLAMQDDIADATRWAIAEGIADPARICIAGASYGGYATLMGLIRDPGLYKCGINWVGVTDIELLYNGHWGRSSDISRDAKRYGLPVLVGDPVKDAAQLAETSPLKQAARVTQPLLLAYGGEDLRVPLYHGRKFHDAVKPTNKHVEWVVYDKEGHGWSLTSTRLDFWGRVEKFLARHIGSKAD